MSNEVPTPVQINPETLPLKSRPSEDPMDLDSCPEQLDHNEPSISVDVRSDEHLSTDEKMDKHDDNVSDTDDINSVIGSDLRHRGGEKQTADPVTDSMTDVVEAEAKTEAGVDDVEVGDPEAGNVEADPAEEPILDQSLPHKEKTDHPSPPPTEESATSQAQAQPQSTRTRPPIPQPARPEKSSSGNTRGSSARGTPAPDVEMEYVRRSGPVGNTSLLQDASRAPISNDAGPQGMSDKVTADLPSRNQAHGAEARQYLNINITPHLLEGMKHLAVHKPEKPLEWLAEYLRRKSEELEGSK